MSDENTSTQEISNDSSEATSENKKEDKGFPDQRFVANIDEVKRALDSISSWNPRVLV